MNELREVKNELRDLADKMIGIESRRRQIFETLLAQYNDDRLARRAIRIMLFEVEHEKLRRVRSEDLEFLYDDIDSEEEEGNEDDSFNA